MSLHLAEVHLREIEVARELGLSGITEIVRFLFGHWPTWSDGQPCREW